MFQKWFQGTLFGCLSCHCAVLPAYHNLPFGSGGKFSVVRLLRLSRFKLEQWSPSHHQEGCGLGEQECNSFWLTKIACLSTEGSKLLRISPIFITGSRDHHQPPSPSEPEKRVWSWHVTQVLPAFLFFVDMSYLSQLLSNSWMGNLPSSVHHWERIKLVLNFTAPKLSKKHLQSCCFTK